MAYTIRPYRDEDAEALAALTVRSIEEIGPHAYSAAQVRVWADRHGDPDEFRKLFAGGATFFVAADAADAAVGYAALAPDGHLDRLYFDPRHTRHGLVDEVLIAAERHAVAHGITRLYTEASDLARPAFERAGYAVTHRRDFTVEGVAIHNYAMEKCLD